MTANEIRGIAVVDAGKTNTKVILFNAEGKPVAERKVASRNSEGPPYRFIDTEVFVTLCKSALPELDAILPIDVVVPCGHGAALACMAKDGSLALPVMDYTAEPPPEITAGYDRVKPPFSEVYSPVLPMALTHALQLYWQQQAFPEAFRRITTVVPWMQYVAFRLGGEAVTEITGMSCQTHLMDVRHNRLSSLVVGQNWQALFPRKAKAWEIVGTLDRRFRGKAFRGRGAVTAGVHDSNANYLRYLAAGLKQFTLLSTGTWIIGFDTEAGSDHLQPERDTVTNTDVFGRIVASCRFFGGYEFDKLTQGASVDSAALALVADLMKQGTFALPGFADGGGPIPGVGGRGRIVGPQPQTAAERASLASLYCAQMVHESLSVIGSRHDVIVDGPFSRNEVFLGVLAALRPVQKLFASDLRDGTTAGAACLGLMPDGKLPHVPLALTLVAPAPLTGLPEYQRAWQAMVARHQAGARHVPPQG